MQLVSLLLIVQLERELQFGRFLQAKAERVIYQKSSIERDPAGRSAGSMMRIGRVHCFWPPYSDIERITEKVG